MTSMDKVHYFGIRHLSPSGAWHLLKFLDEIKPSAVLIEGPEDATHLIRQLVSDRTIPPVAILAYTNKIPIKTILYPLALYSPEYQAMKWAHQNNVEVKFIDIPSYVTLSLEHLNMEISQSENVYEKWAHLAGEEKHETYWERNFEHNLNHDTYRFQTIEFGTSMRILSKEHPYEEAKNVLRESFMKRKIQDTVALGHEKIVIITGAYHTKAIESDSCIPLSDDEINQLPHLDASITLMPYSYLRLSTRTGYGAGNDAPYYYELLWNAINKNDLASLSYHYMSLLASHLREAGHMKSSAEVIEAVRLANTLAALHDGYAPTLMDLRDAAIVCLGQGDRSNVATGLARVDVGTKIGSLPEGVSRTSIQDDFYRELKRLNLDKYKTNIAMNIELDLRENRRVKSIDSAFIDLNRSFFFHRLNVLGISFVQKANTYQQNATWQEHWVLKWSEESEIELVEAVLLGETIELACAYSFKERLDQCQSVREAASIIRLSTECNLLESMEYALHVLQQLATSSNAFIEFAEAALELAVVIDYKDIRQYDSDHFIPLLSQLFLRATLLLLDASHCDHKLADQIINAITILNKISLEHCMEVDERLWIKHLKELSNRDDKNPKVSGFACAILLERGELNIDDLSSEISRRLSPGIEADLGTGWFEGLSQRNRYVLLSKLELWEQVDHYIESLDDEQYKRALVFLRRAFSTYGMTEKHHIAQNLGQIWGLDQDATEEYLSNELNKEEQEKLNELSDFDFGDF